jgi:hypothetical protein
LYSLVRVGRARCYHLAIAHGVPPDFVCLPRAVLPEYRDFDDGVEEIVLPGIKSSVSICGELISFQKAVKSAEVCVKGFNIATRQRLRDTPQYNKKPHLSLPLLQL